MDFNDIQLRLKRIYSSINESSDNDIEKYILIKQTSASQFLITFDNGQEESDVTNVVMGIIGHLAKLKDHLKNLLEKNGIDKEKIEGEINDSVELQLVIDLANSDKHGYPLTRPERSKRSPRIQNIHSALVIPPQKEFRINLSKGKIIKDDGCSISITAEIVDSDGNLIMRLSKLADNALKKWEEIIVKYNLNQ